MGKKHERVVVPSASAPRHRSWWITTLTAVGSTLLLGSFISQNYYKSRWSDERARLARSQLVVDVAEVRMEHWQTLLRSEQSRPAPDQELLKLAALKYIESLGNLEAWAAVKTMQDVRAANLMLGVKNAITKRAQDVYRRGDLRELIRLANQLGASVKDLDEKFDLNERFKTLVDAVNAEEAWWDRMYMSAYIVGSIIVGTAFLLGRHGRLAEA